MDKANFLRKQLVQAEFDDGMGLAAANFHNRPWLCRDLMQSLR
jgi:hypothetical protein